SGTTSRMCALHPRREHRIDPGVGKDSLRLMGWRQTATPSVTTFGRGADSPPESGYLVEVGTPTNRTLRQPPTNTAGLEYVPSASQLHYPCGHVIVRAAPTGMRWRWPPDLLWVQTCSRGMNAT